jgi:hypothetical protein
VNIIISAATVPRRRGEHPIICFLRIITLYISVLYKIMENTFRRGRREYNALARSGGGRERVMGYACVSDIVYAAVMCKKG